jgi:hypothetical protein
VTKSLSCACAIGAALLVSIAPTGTIAQPAPAPKSNPGQPAAAKQTPQPAAPGAPAPAPQAPAPGAPAPAPQAPAPQAPALQAPALQGPSGLQVSIEQVLYLIRSTLLTLNDANRSGNYSVLRDLAAPDFQAKNTAADLAVSFTDLRRRNFDLYAAALVAPQLTEAPAIDAGGKLHISGIFPTRPLQIKFDLMFEVSAGQWKLFGIAIATPDAPPLEAQEQKQAPKSNPKATAATPAEPGKRP